VAESPSDLPTPSDGPTASEPPDERPVACGGQLPANADQPKEGFPEVPADSLEKGKDYQATITTSCGKISVDLLEKDAPKTVSNFVFLAEQGFWDGLEIFRNAASIGALQTGAGNNSASYDHGYTIPDELKAAERLGYKPGTLAMANTGQPNSGSSQFFFVYNDKFTLDPTYAVFGVADEAGAKVLEEIGGIPTAAPDDPSNELPSERVFMESVKITAK
jgi:cyclophilin family peptidyl-prolyl cis-trans isomerase